MAADEAQSMCCSERACGCEELPAAGHNSRDIGQARYVAEYELTIPVAAGSDSASGSLHLRDLWDMWQDVLTHGYGPVQGLAGARRGCTTHAAVRGRAMAVCTLCGQ